MKEVKKHHKHALLTKPMGGEYHRQEWAIIGAPCSVIKKLADQINDALSSEYSIGFLDAAHNAPKEISEFSLTYMDNISAHNIEFKNEWRQKNSRKYFNHLDLLLVNGNHFAGDKQILILDDRKEDSLKRKLNRLTDVRVMLRTERTPEPYPWLTQEVPTDPDVIDISNLEQLVKIIVDDFIASIAPLNGLVLSGGKSLRMGKDKGAIVYHGKAQREHMADVLKPFCNSVSISLREKQGVELNEGYEALYDTFSGLGPFGGILSAMRQSPNNAWLTVACDQPFLNKDHIDLLVSKRNPSKLATCFHNPETDLPEPLLTIWEPRAYPVLFEFLSQGYACPRKVLINSDIEMLPCPDDAVLLNANTPEEYDAALKAL